MTELELRTEICQIGQWLWNKNLVGAVEGNISCRLPEDNLLCTPAGLHKGTLKPGDLSVVTLEGGFVSGPRPSSELLLHLEIYARRPDCKAVVHAHPPVATAFAMTHQTLPDNYSPEAAHFLGSVALVPFAMPGSPETQTVIRPLLEFHKAFLLSNHGAVTLGATLFDAFSRMETLERVLQVYMLSNLIDQPKPLPAEAFHWLLEHSLNGKL